MFKRNKKSRALIDGIYDRFKKGDIDEAETRRLVIEAAGGMGTPEWARSGTGAHDSEAVTSYEGELSRSQVLGGVRVGRGAGGNDTSASISAELIFKVEGIWMVKKTDQEGILKAYSPEQDPGTEEYWRARAKTSMDLTELEAMLEAGLISKAHSTNRFGSWKEHGEN